MEKLIHKNIYKGQIRKSDKAELHLCYCSADKCKALDNGKCIHLGMFKSCIYGRKVKQDGYTRKSKKFSEWIEKRELEYADTPSLKSCEFYASDNDYTVVVSDEQVDENTIYL